MVVTIEQIWLMTYAGDLKTVRKWWEGIRSILRKLFWRRIRMPDVYSSRLETNDVSVHGKTMRARVLQWINRVDQARAVLASICDKVIFFQIHIIQCWTFTFEAQFFFLHSLHDTVKRKIASPRIRSINVLVIYFIHVLPSFARCKMILHRSQTPACPCGFSTNPFNFPHFIDRFVSYETRDLFPHRSIAFHNKIV